MWYLCFFYFLFYILYLISYIIHLPNVTYIDISPISYRYIIKIKAIFQPFEYRKYLKIWNPLPPHHSTPPFGLFPFGTFRFWAAFLTLRKLSVILLSHASALCPFCIVFEIFHYKVSTCANNPALSLIGVCPRLQTAMSTLMPIYLLLSCVMCVHKYSTLAHDHVYTLLMYCTVVQKFLSDQSEHRIHPGDTTQTPPHKVKCWARVPWLKKVLSKKNNTFRNQTLIFLLNQS